MTLINRSDELAADDDPRGVPRAVSLRDKYELETGRIFCSGLQAIARLPFDQRRADARAGLRTAGFVSGYQGSPLGGLDQELEAQSALCAALDVVVQPGLNEELAATSVGATQLVAGRSDATVDGVAGWWYGKNPGLDRASDAIRHAGVQGASPTGGMVLLVGDDPGSKSSTIPSAAEATLAALHAPVLYPGSVQEILDYGAHAVALSRASGLWSAMKLVTSVADAAATAEVAHGRVVPAMPTVLRDGKPFVHEPSAMLLAPQSLALERSLLDVRLEAVRAYQHANRLDRVEGAHGNAWIGIAAAGRSYREVVSALALLGLSHHDLDRHGIRLLHIAMPWPLHAETLREFADGLEEIVVVEEKLGFVEDQVRQLLYRAQNAPHVVGKRDDDGRTLLHADGELTADEIAVALATRLRRRVHDEHLDAAAARVGAARRVSPGALPLARTPAFCSGCPHNTSTAAPEGTVVGAGIGCHTMVLLNPEGKGDIAGITQMGGEGAQWIGMAPFVSSDHLVQNLGDGTFHHSGSLAIRAAVAAKAHLTYKLLYNGFVSMTGGQDIEGQLSVADLTRWLALEGVTRVIVTTEDVKRYRRVRLDPIAEVRPREAMEAAQRDLAATAGVTVLIHDQVCAAEKRRLVKRGKLAAPKTHVHINERVCEGCGDCGAKSSCLSVQPVDTDLGEKTRIHQASCNTDLSCLNGDCPSFVTIEGGDITATHVDPPTPPADLPEPVRGTTAMIRMIGIGGTGVVTVSQILGMAAHLDGLHVSALDQTGLAQKGGPVVSDVRIAPDPIVETNRAAPAGVDAYLAFDALGGADPKNLRTADPQRTVAVVSTSVTPTGAVVADRDKQMPAVDFTVDRILRRTDATRAVLLDAQALSQRLFGDHLPANAIVLGAAYQRGLLPVSADALERAFALNGVAVERNIAALRWGRAVVAAPDAVAALTAPAAPAPRTLPATLARAVDACCGDDAELHDLVSWRAAELVAYQSARYAARYVDAVAEVRARETAATPERTTLTAAVARNLFKLMAYKDEYEVARLHLDPVEQARVREQFGDGARAKVMLHPPVLRALGMRRKIALGASAKPLFGVLRGARRLRGTPLDPFGHTAVRRIERALGNEYLGHVRAALAVLDGASHATAVEIAELGDLVRGYEDIKLAGVERMREQATTLRTSIGA